MGRAGSFSANKYVWSGQKIFWKQNRLQSISPGVKPARYTVETIAVNLKLWLLFPQKKNSREVREVRRPRSLFFFSLPVCLLKLQSAQDVNRLQELSRWQHCYKLLRLQFFSTTELHKTVSSLHSLTEVHPVWVIRYEKQKPLECHKKKEK